MKQLIDFTGYLRILLNYYVIYLFFNNKKNHSILLRSRLISLKWDLLLGNLSEVDLFTVDTTTLIQPKCARFMCMSVRTLQQPSAANAPTGGLNKNARQASKKIAQARKGIGGRQHGALVTETKRPLVIEDNAGHSFWEKRVGWKYQ